MGNTPSFPSRSGTEWHRVSRDRPCPICGKPDWCLYAGPSDQPDAALCARNESNKRCGDAGWLHQLHSHADRNQERRVRRVRIPCSDDVPDFGRFAQRCAEAAEESPVAQLAAQLGVSAGSLRRLMLGWSEDHKAWSLPMCGADGTVIGIRLRASNGRKFAVKGSREGLFIPTDLVGSGRLLVCEGPTDTAALLDLGFQAVGRPNCNGGFRYIRELVMRSRPSDLVIMADADGPGQRGACQLERKIRPYVPAVRTVTPPAGVKDVREWKLNGATAEEIFDLVESVEVRKLQPTITWR